MQSGDGRAVGVGGWVLLEARLHGGAPWGFTLQGGLEHGEPLIISKVEAGGKADALLHPLLVGDELISINGVELMGFRQDAVALVKGSHKTLHVTVCRELHPGHTQDHSAPPPAPPPASPPHCSRTNSTGGIQLRINNRRSEPVSRPHSWHSTKLSDGRLESTDRRGTDAMSSAWHHSYTASASDLSAAFDSGGGCLRKSPDQYSSRGSMESLDPPTSSQLHPGTQHHHPLRHHTHSGPHPAYSSCHQLSSARSSNSIDLLHNKRDSAYSSFSTSSSIPEYLTSAPSFSDERSYSLETVPQRGGGGADVQQADVRYFRTVYDAQQEQELSCTSRGGGAKVGPNRHLQGSVGGICYHGGSSMSDRHSVGPIWGPTAGHSSNESLKGVPAPPRRSDSYAAIRNHERHERPNSWSSLDHARSLRSLQKGSWHHSSGSVSSGSAKASFSAEGQLHTVMEKSPESSPTTKPRQGGAVPQTPSPPSTQLILPTGLYPAPLPEPLYVHIPSSGPAPGASGVYPTLTRENHRQQHQGPQGSQGPQGPQGSQGPQVRWDEAAAEGWRDGGMSAVENRYQSSTSPLTSATTSAKFRTQEVDRTPKDEADFGPYRPHQKAPVGGSEVQTNAQRLQNNPIHKNPGSQNQMFQEQIQEVHSTKIHPTHGLRPPSSQDWKDSYTMVESRHWSRSLDQPNIYPETLSSSRAAQGLVPPPHLLVHPQPQAPPPSAVHMSPCHHSISAVPHQPPFDQTEPDREHPLTRLEIALAEVQRCDSPFSATSNSSCHGNSGFADASQGPARSLSVLEKVSRFEHRERAVKQRSHSTKANHHRINEKSQNTSCGAEDLRNMLERSTNGSKAHRTLSYRGGNNHVTHRTSADPSSALQRSRSSFHLDASRVDDVNKDLPRKQDVQELMNMQDMSTNRSYQDSLKDAQSKDLHSISFRRRDLDSSSSPSPPVAPPLVSSSSSRQPPPVPTKYHSLEKKGPKTLPKPQGVIITSTSPPPVTSPHTPKERHVVSPEVRGPSPPALPSVPPVGPPPLMRICGRKRLMADQKKRSYSEPENMNEVGVSDAETAAFFRRTGDTSVADRRKMFELAASCVGGGASHSSSSRTDLRQLQQDALFEYVERKRGARRDEVGTRACPRPRSAYIQPEHANSHSDSSSLSTSSRFSLQDCGPDWSLSSEDHRPGSTLPSGGDLRSFQSNLFYPGQVTSPRPPAHLPPSAAEVQISSSQCLLDLSPEGPAGQQVSEPRLESGLSRQLDGALQRAGSARGSGKSASAEDLLERSDQMQISPQHCRSWSSPTTETLNQDIRTSSVSVSDPGPSGPAGPTGPRCVDVNRAVQASCDQGSPAVENCSDPGSVHPPVSCRDRQRTTERQRAHSTSTLAASVGLVQGGGGAEWKASERLSQANLDAITFPGTGTRTGTKTSTRDVDGSQHVSTSDSGKDSYRGRAFSLETRPERCDPVQPLSPPAEGTVPHPPSVQPRPPSLRISESTLQTPLESVLNQVYSDKVFIPNPTPPSPLPIRETDIMEDLPQAPPPAPPPPVDVDQETPPQTDSSPSPCFQASSVPLPWPLPRPHPSSTQTPPAVDLDLNFEPLPRRQKTPEQLRVERLARQLVLHDRSLASLLDTWGGKSTVEVMEEIFPNSKIVGRSPWQHRGSSQLDGRILDGVSVGNVNLEDQIQDQDQENLNSRKVELCEALRSSMEALRSEKEALQEEVKAHTELGVHVDTLVQQNCTSHQRDKYNMFIGDLERIVNLLLSLCGRMSRIDRCLQSLQMGGVTEEGVAEERDCLLHKRSQLLRQTEDARELKENLERRQRTVHAFLTANLSEVQLLHYRRFIAAKPSLLIRQRCLDELIRQGEEQLTHLAYGLPELADAHGGSMTCPPSPAPCSPLFPQLIPGPTHIVRSTTVTSL